MSILDNIMNGFMCCSFIVLIQINANLTIYNCNKEQTKKEKKIKKKCRNAKQTENKTKKKIRKLKILNQ